MSDKTIKKTKAELLEMLAEAVRNTQPQTSGPTAPEPIQDAQAEPKRKAGPMSKRAAKTKKAPASAKRKERRR